MKHGNWLESDITKLLGWWKCLYLTWESMYVHFFCMCFIAHSCLTLCSTIDCRVPGPSAHGIFWARILEQVAISYSRGSSHPRIEHVSPHLLHCRQILYHWTTSATWEVQIINLKSMYFTAYKSHSRKKYSKWFDDGNYTWESISWNGENLFNWFLINNNQLI